MDFLGKIELFSRTFDNRFVFNLFNLLLCGVIVLVIVRGWRAHITLIKDRPFLILAFSLLGASFALGVLFTGAFFFFRRAYSEGSFDLLIHGLWASAWLMLAASTYQRPATDQSSPKSANRLYLPFSLLTLLWLSIAIVLFVPDGRAPSFFFIASFALDLLNLFLLTLAFICFHRRPLGRHNFARGALSILLLAALLHLISFAEMGERASIIVWNLEQFAWALALLTLALAIGETSKDLFDRVFVGLQVTFILLASLMILVITQTEKVDYLTSIRARSDELAEFVRANVDYLGHEDKALPEIVEREDFLQRAMLGFGHIPELKIVRIASGTDVAMFEIGDDGEISRDLRTLPATNLRSQLDAEKYFLIQSLPLNEAGPGAVEFYGTREVLDRHIRKRIVIIFALFTGLVVLSTLMIGLVVRGASVTIRQQAHEIEKAQHRLMQASKLAAIGQLATGVAHEINNPATAILTRASFLLSDDEASVSPSDREDLQAIVAQAQRIARITHNLLSFSRPQVRRIRPAKIDRVIENSLLLVRDAMKANSIAVEKDLPPRLPQVMADEESLIRALENIYRNAIDAMPDGGRLRIRARKNDHDPERLRLEISDTGTGISRDDLARIFDPFFTTKEVGKGTGLGLSIVHGIISEHQGTITVESEMDEGTTFVILLPAEE
jgi:signal transduction histidine kinase